MKIRLTFYFRALSDRIFFDFAQDTTRHTVVPAMIFRKSGLSTKVPSQPKRLDFDIEK
jgi:hypothetical protein